MNDSIDLRDVLLDSADVFRLYIAKLGMMRERLANARPTSGREFLHGEGKCSRFYSHFTHGRPGSEQNCKE